MNSSTFSNSGGGGSRRRAVPAGIVTSVSGNHKDQELVPLSDIQHSYLDDDDAMLDRHNGENGSYEDLEQANPEEGLTHVVVPTSEGRSCTKRGMLLCFLPFCLTMIGLGLWVSLGLGNRSNFNDTNSMNKNGSSSVLDPQYYDVSIPSSEIKDAPNGHDGQNDNSMTANPPQEVAYYEVDSNNNNFGDNIDEYIAPNKEREPDVLDLSSSQTGEDENGQIYNSPDELLVDEEKTEDPLNQDNHNYDKPDETLVDEEVINDLLDSSSSQIGEDQNNQSQNKPGGNTVDEEVVEDLLDSLLNPPSEIETFDDDLVPPSAEQKSNSEAKNSEDLSQSDNLEEDQFYEVVARIPHNSDSFTQGLTYFNGLLYESTGLYGLSKVCHLDPSTGDELKCIQMESKYFGEGLAYVHDDESSDNDGDALVQITWKSSQGFVYDPKTLDLLYQFTYNTETTQGWGITYIPSTRELIVSDGSEYLHYWDATDIRQPRDYFLETRERQAVTLDSSTKGKGKGSPVKNLNELEYIRGWIFANVWQTDLIMKIHPVTGEVDEVWDMAQLYPMHLREPGSDVLNGISIVQDGDELGDADDGDLRGGSIEVFVTGKKWPTIYRIKLPELQGLARPTPQSVLDTSSTSSAETIDNDMDDSKVADDEHDQDLGGKAASPSPLEMIECPAIGACYEVLSSFDHDTSSFTQGLTFANDILYESTGRYGKSKVRRLDPKTGTVELSFDMDSEFFGEGMTYMKTKGGKEELVQITWKEQTGIVYNAHTLKEVRRFPYDTHTTQGWGITYMANVNELVVSDGSQWLHFWNGTAGDKSVDYSYPELRRIEVKYPETNEIVEQINELEYMDSSGLILANIWYQNIIVAIDPSTGFVTKVYDFDELWPMNQRPRSADCLNGISITDKPGELFVTGKKWPTIYRIKMLDNLS